MTAPTITPTAAPATGTGWLTGAATRKSGTTTSMSGSLRCVESGVPANTRKGADRAFGRSRLAEALWQHGAGRSGSMTSPRRSPPTCAPAALATHRPPTEKIGPTSTHGAGLAGLPAAPETVGH